jgi:hypothetical protein
MTTEDLNDLRLRLHNYGKGDWARKICTTDYKSRVADGCIDALDQFDRYESEISQLRLDLAQHLGNASEVIRLQAELENTRKELRRALSALTRHGLAEMPIDAGDGRLLFGSSPDVPAEPSNQCSSCGLNHGACMC